MTMEKKNVTKPEYHCYCLRVGVNYLTERFTRFSRQSEQVLNKSGNEFKHFS